jgi:catechol 2,3-dioxygenase-like lactoylglutathione lyase family enzyme
MEVNKMPETNENSVADLIVRPHHTAVSVADFESARDFFVNIIGMKLEGEVNNRDEENLGLVVGLPGAVIRWALLERDGYRIELFKYHTPEGREVPIRQCDYGLTHMAFEVSDTDEVFRRLKELGYETLSDPLELRGGVTKPIYVKGPGGIIIEFLEIRK